MEIDPGVPRRLHAASMSVVVVLGLALAAGCSDDGLANQSSGQAETSTTGTVPPSDAGAGGSEHALDTGGLDGGTTAAGGGTVATSDGPGGDTATATLGPEIATDTDGPATSSSTTIDIATGGTETESTTGGPNQACVDGCAVEFMCGTEWMSAEDCVSWCEANLVEANEFSPFCRDAWEGVSACVATLTCEEFMQWQDPMEFPYPCSDADVTLSVECKGQ